MTERTPHFSNALDVTFLTCSVGLYTIARQVVDGQSYVTRGPIARFICDSISLAIPLLFLYTLGFGYNILVNALLFCFLSLILLLKFRLKERRLYPPLNSEYLYNAHKTYVTAYRSYVTLSTVICILAVDFSNIFPSMYGKSYHSGYSLMDTGVGSFVFMSGIVAPEARMNSIADNKLKILKKSLSSGTVLIVIGVLRTLILGVMEYDVSEDEYGRDWNFFLTLATVKILSSIILCVVPVLQKTWIISLVIAVAYQIALSNFNLFVKLEDGFDGHNSHGYGFINANREGLFSSVGMLSIYFAGLSLGVYIFKKRELLSHTLSLWGGMVGVTVLVWLATLFCHSHIQVGSRCFGNITYILWSVAHNMTLLCVLLSVEILFHVLSHIKQGTLELPLYQAGETRAFIPGGCSECVANNKRTSCACLLSAISKNQLLYFLLGNIFTGVVNMWIQPHYHYRSTTYSTVVMLVYLVAVNGTVTSLFVYRLTAKFW